MKHRAIIIDDDVDTLEVLEEYLSIHDIEVLGKATNGKEGTELYSETKPDVVVSDIMMPQYDGFYAIENIRKTNPDAKIIVTTADLTVRTEEKLKVAKPNKILFKPYELTDLQSSIKALNEEQTILA